MKQMFKNISIFALSVCCGVFYSVDSQSKVCFLGDEDCTDNVSFDFNFIDVEKECKEEGYTIKVDNCKTPYEYCPHSNMWVKCCNEQEYYYDSCDNNTTEKGRCGYGNNYKYKCECDRSIYAFNNNSCSTRDPVKSADASYSCTEKIIMATQPPFMQNVAVISVNTNLKRRTAKRLKTPNLKTPAATVTQTVSLGEKTPPLIMLNADVIEVYIRKM